MESSVKIAIIIAITILIVAFMGYSLFNKAMPVKDTISSQGSAEIKTMPDIVAVYLSIETNASDATTAKDKNANISEDVTTALLKLGLERKDITTQSYNIYEEFDWTDEGRKSIGWKASNQLKVELKSEKTDMAGDVIDAGVDNGARVSYINFELSLTEENKYKAQALTLATQDAKVKAEAIATGLEKKLGDVVSVSNLGWGYNPWPLYRDEGVVMAGAAEAKQAVTDIQPGEQTVSASVSVVYKIA